MSYRTCARAEGRSPKTVSWVEDAVCYFARFLGSDIEIDLVNANDLRRFITALQGKKAFSNHPFTATQNRPLSPHTVASYARAIRCFFAFLEREEILPANPVKKVRIPKTPHKVMPAFTEAELERLLAQPDRKSSEGYRDYLVMLTLLDTGIRVSELSGLKLDDVDLYNGYLRVLGKGSKERYVPVGAKLSKALLKYRTMYRPADNGCASYFLTRDGRPLAKRRIQGFIREYGRRAGIRTRCSPHTFRSSSAVIYLRRGGDVFSLQRKLGHSDLTMTRRYSELANSDVRAAHLRYSPADGLRV